jgi:hypothetical protein
LRTRERLFLLGFFSVGVCKVLHSPFFGRMVS